MTPPPGYLITVPPGNPDDLAVQAEQYVDHGKPIPGICCS